MLPSPKLACNIFLSFFADHNFCSCFLTNIEVLPSPKCNIFLVFMRNTCGSILDESVQSFRSDSTGVNTNGWTCRISQLQFWLLWTRWIDLSRNKKPLKNCDSQIWLRMNFPLLTHSWVLSRDLLIIGGQGYGDNSLTSFWQFPPSLCPVAGWANLALNHFPFPGCFRAINREIESWLSPGFI